jgi:transcriptional regulator with XRE-family HTH domain
MKVKDIRELMALRGWNQRELAAKLETEESTVSRWLRELQFPTGPARVLLREWLTQARDESRKQPA